jgi:hypothetical protein
MVGSVRRQARILAAALALALGCADDDDEAPPDGSADSGRGSPGGQEAGRGGGTAGDGRGAAGEAGDTSSGEAGSRAGTSGGEAGRGEAGNGEAGEPGDSDAAVDAGEDSPGECDPRALEHAHDSMAAMHVPQPLPASDYNSSPPSSGPHCGTWGQYTVYADPALPACNFLHNLEHGAIVLLYNCPSGCPEIVQQLAQVIQDAPADPDCGSAGKRLLLTPYAEMDATIAAAAWGYTFTAECLDDTARTALLGFITAHQGSAGDAPEPTVCANGSVGP